MMFYIFFTVDVSEEFEHFLELMGDKIELKGWQKYRGGLDVKSKIRFSRRALCLCNNDW